MNFKATKVMIRKFINLVVLVFCGGALFSQPIANFETKTIDFGTVLEGSVCKYSFKFKNTGDKPLEISNVSVTCGCTVPRWEHKPIQAGDTSSIYIEFNTMYKRGAVAKGVNLTTNCAEPMVGLIILANIIPDSNFKAKVDSTSWKPLKVLDQNGYYQITVPVQTMWKKGFKGDGVELDALAKLIISEKGKALAGNIWYTSTTDQLIINCYTPEFKKLLIETLAPELKKKKKVKAWQKKLKQKG